MVRRGPLWRFLWGRKPPSSLRLLRPLLLSLRSKAPRSLPAGGWRSPWLPQPDCPHVSRLVRKPLEGSCPLSWGGGHHST